MAKSPGCYPRLFPEPDQTMAGIGRALREGRTSCVKILESCLAQVDRWEPKVHAWVVLDIDRALEHARGLDDELKNGNDRGPLHGIPIGIKDIIDVAGLPTACGSKRWAGRVPSADADVVCNLREAGAVIMGKTVTTPYAWIDPPVTRNPWNLERTPGGSSSGSAAAVACGMCYGAVGTQTGGSITRPASFCGVAGMKPAHTSLGFDGVFPFASSLDHIGPIARTVEDLRLIFCAMRSQSKNEKPRVEHTSPLQSPPLLGRLRGFFDRRAEPALSNVIDSAVGVLSAHRADIAERGDPVDFEAVLNDHRRVMAAECAGVHSHWLDQFPDDYPPRIRDLIVEGRSLSAVAYLQAKARMDQTTNAILETLGEHPRKFWITPATTSTATDPSTTGNPAFNSPWSYTGLPTVSFPVAIAPDGLPVAIQLVGCGSLDEQLLEAAQWCEQAIRSGHQ